MDTQKEISTQPKKKNSNKIIWIIMTICLLLPIVIISLIILLGLAAFIIGDFIYMFDYIFEEIMSWLYKQL